MKYRKNNNSTLFNNKENGIRKSPGECTMNISMHNWINEMIS